MASVDRRSGKYVVRYRVDGKSRQRTFKTHKDALDFRATVEAESRTGQGFDPVRGRTTYEAWWPVWQRGRVGLRPATLATSKSLYVNHISRWNTWTLESIRQPDVQSWVADLAATTAKPATISAIYKDFAGSMKAAAAARYIRESPCVSINLPRVTQEHLTVLDHAEIAALAESINPRYRALVVFLAYSGLRIGEAAALAWSDVDLTDGSVQVRGTVTEVAAQGLSVTPPKTAAGRRRVPLPQHVLDALRRHQGDAVGPWVFTTGSGAQLNPRAFNRRSFQTALARAGLDCRVHDLRHTAISLWIRAGVDLPRVKAWAGHTDAAFTLNRYAKFFPTDDASILDRLNENIVKNLTPGA